MWLITFVDLVYFLLIDIFFLEDLQNNRIQTLRLYRHQLKQLHKCEPGYARRVAAVEEVGCTFALVQRCAQFDSSCRHAHCGE